MVKRKLVLVGLIIVVLLGVSVTVGMWVSKKSDKQVTSSEESQYKPNVAEATVLEETKDFNEVLSAYNGGTYEESLTKSQAYAKNTSKSITERLGAYKICIASALKLEKKEDATRCKDEATVLIATATDQKFKDGWTYEIAVTYDPTLIKESQGQTDVVSQ